MLARCCRALWVNISLAGRRALQAGPGGSQQTKHSTVSSHRDGLLVTGKEKVMLGFGDASPMQA